MPKLRVHELAKLYGVDSRTVLEQAKLAGEFVKSASSTLDARVEQKVRARLDELVDSTRPRDGISPDIEPTTRASDRLVDDGAPHTRHDVTGASSDPPPRLRRPGLPSTNATVPVLKIPERLVHLNSMSSPGDLDLVIKECKAATGRTEPVRLAFDLSDAKGFYPSVTVPIVAVLQYFRELGLAVELRNSPTIAERMSIRNPLEASAENLNGLNEPLSRVWVYFDHQQANMLTTAFMSFIRRKIECEAGVLEALEWCLYEVLDNVMQHSGSGAGYAMFQLHVQGKRLAVGISDTGIGVQRSLASSNAYRPPTAFDALTLAVREGVTRNQKTNQGNGLFGLVRILEQNGGRVSIRSGRGRMDLQGNRVTGANDRQVLAPDHHGTFVDFQLKVDRPVSLGDALNYSPTNLFLESLESDEGEHVLSIRDQAGGAGSRIAARELKTLIVNCLNEGAQHVALDFEGQAVVSSSFADEVIGKLFLEMGFNTFNARIKLRNMNETVGALVDRAIARRMSQGAD